MTQLDWGLVQSEAGGGKTWMDPVDVAKIMAAIAEVGATRVRFGVQWNLVEPKNGKFVWDGPDVAMARALDNGLQPLLVPLPPRPSNGSESEFGLFCRALVQRYAVDGFTFEGKQYPPAPNIGVQIFNEVNNSGFSVILTGNPLNAIFPISVSAYIKYLRAAYENVKAIAPSVQVLTSGLQGAPLDGTGGTLTVSAPTWVQDFCDAGGHAFCDALAFHPYSTTSGFKPIYPTPDIPAYKHLTQVRAILDANGAAGLPIICTEWGFDTDRWTPEQHSDMTMTQWAQLLEFQRQGVIAECYLYCCKDVPKKQDSEATRGILYRDYSKKPVWQRLKDASGVDPVSGLGVDFRSMISLTFTGSTSVAPTDQAKYQHTFTGNTKPTSLFNEFGTGYTVSGGKAQHGAPPHTAGTYYGGFIHKDAQLSPNHCAQVTRSNLSPATAERSVMAIVRSDALGNNFVGATCHMGGAKSTQLLMRTGGGALVEIARGRGELKYSGDDLLLVVDTDPDGVAVYQVWVQDKWSDEFEQVFEWRDTEGVTGALADNLHVGGGFQHRYSAGEWNSTGIEGTWYGQDLRPTPIVGGGDGYMALGLMPELTFTASTLEIMSVPLDVSLTFTGSTPPPPPAAAEFLAAGTSGRTTANTTSAVSASGSMTIPAGATDTAVVVAAALSTGYYYGDPGGDTLPAMTATYGGAPMVFLGHAQIASSYTANNGYVAVWILYDPPAGTATFTATFGPAKRKRKVEVTATAYQYVDYVTGFATDDDGGAAVISTADGIVVAAHVSDTKPTAVSGTQRYRGGADVSGLGDWLTVQDIPGNGTGVALSVTGPDDAATLIFNLPKA